MRTSSLFLAISAFVIIPSVAVANPQVEVGFTPPVNGRSSLDVVLDGINHTQTQVLVAAYSFTSKPIAEALVNAKARGVEVHVVADAKANDAHYSAVTFLANHGVPVRLNDRYAIMHNKFMVLDGRNVETGSFNYTQAAAKSNAENAILMLDVPDIASKYAADFRKLWDEGDIVNPSY